MPKLRALWHCVRGLVERRQAGPNVSAIVDTIGAIPGKPHLFKVRSGFLDTDINFHMNNASFLSQAEFARWHMLAKGGLFEIALKEKWQFMVGSQFTRFRYGLQPFKSYELRTELAHISDDKWLYFRHRFVDPKSERVMAQVFIRAFAFAKGDFVSTRRMASAMGLDEEQYQVLCQTDLPMIEPFLECDGEVQKDMDGASTKVLKS